MATMVMTVLLHLYGYSCSSLLRMKTTMTTTCIVVGVSMCPDCFGKMEAEAMVQASAAGCTRTTEAAKGDLAPQCPP